MSERGLSERWIDQRAALLEGGATRRLPARCWMRKISSTSAGLVLLNPAFLVAFAIVEMVQPPDPPTWYADVGLYPADARPGALPLVIVPFPVEVGTVVQERGDLVVRGEPTAGRGLVALLPAGAVGCAGPASPPPAFRRKHVRFS